MMTLNMLAIFVALFSLWNAADANLGESLEMRIYDRESRLPDHQIQMMLDKVVLEEHGFKLEITSKLLSEPESGSDKPIYQKTYFYFKTVDCSQVPEVNEEVDSLIPGVFGATVLSKIRVEIKTRDLGNLKKCQTGLEVHFKEAGGYYGNRKTRSASRYRGHFWCSKTKVLMSN